jgi:transcriptional/translational regulatory protein YebC/TACO1
MKAQSRLRLAIQRREPPVCPKTISSVPSCAVWGKLGSAVEMEETTYEGYGPDGVAYLVDTLSDNKTALWLK